MSELRILSLGGGTQSCALALIRVPHGWHEWQVDDEYTTLTGGAFLDALPDSVPPNMTEYACTTMNVERVAIGSVIPEPDRPLDAVASSLFDEAQA